MFILPSLHLPLKIYKCGRNTWHRVGGRGVGRVVDLLLVKTLSPLQIIHLIQRRRGAGADQESRHDDPEGDGEKHELGRKKKKKKKKKKKCSLFQPVV